jgi:RNA polymerase sigma-70 factor (ECF subfamily)
VNQDNLTQRWQNGDPDAFDELYSRYSQALYRLGWAMLQNRQTAEDVVQETFLRAYKARRRFDPSRASIGTWLYQIALNYCRSQLRRKRPVIIPWIEQIDSTSEPETSLLRAEYQRAIWKAIQKLGPILKEVIILHYYLDLPAVKIAAILKCPEGTIYSRLYNARRRLAQLLAQEGISLSDLTEASHAS